VAAQLRLELDSGTTPSLEGIPTLTPFIKWPGGKSLELPAIATKAPPLTGRLIDPFVGGGSVLLATPPHVPAWANDACEDLVRLYAAAASKDAALKDALDGVATAWAGLDHEGSAYRDLAEVFLRADDHTLPVALARHESRFVAHVRRAGPGLEDRFLSRLRVDLGKKFARTRVVEDEVGWRLPEQDLVATVEGSVRAAMYMAIRARYNKARLAASWGPYREADFLFLREFAYAAMFRFNARDEFNVPYGGKTYNRKSFAQKVETLFDPLLRRRLETTTWRSSDFASFLDEAEPNEADFVFADPPYDSDFSAYDNLAFGSQDQARLRDYLEAVPARVMVVIKDTPMIRELYGTGRWQISEAPKTYRWTIKSRNDRAATHLTIINY